MIRIALADDHPIVRDGLRSLLDLEEDFSIVAEAETGRETIEMCLLKKPDVLLLDLDMPDMDGLDVAKRLNDDLPEVKIIVLTMYGTEEYAVRLLKSGASGLVPKSQSAHKLPEIIREVMRGKVYLPDELKDTVLATMVESGRRRVSCLSDRELQVFSGYASGKDRSEIAEMMNVSPKTVDAHKQNIMEKLGLKNTADLVKTAIREGIIKRY